MTFYIPLSNVFAYYLEALHILVYDFSLGVKHKICYFCDNYRKFLYIKQEFHMSYVSYVNKFAKMTVIKKATQLIKKLIAYRYNDSK